MFDLGAQELIVIFIVAFLVFGPKRLPELGRTLGKGIRELKDAMRQMKESIEESDLDISKEVSDARKDIESSVKDAVAPDAYEKGGAGDKKQGPSPDSGPAESSESTQTGETGADKT